MVDILTKVRGILAVEIAGADIQIEPVRGNGRVWGFVIWKDWEGVEPIDRVGRVREVLHSRLSNEEELQISAILPMTPEELRED